MNTRNPKSENGGYISNNPLFRTLTEEEVAEFRAHARENYVVGSEINETWHPVYQQECIKMNAEAKIDHEENWPIK
jgi:hypothetical protein